VLYRTAAAVPAGNFTARLELTEATSISLSWTAPTSPNGVIQRYVLTVLDGANEVVEVHEGLSLGQQVEGLTPYSRYVFVVSACTTAGCLNTSVTSITRQAPPTGQSPPIITASTPVTLDVSWQPPSHPNGKITHWAVMF